MSAENIIIKSELSEYSGGNTPSPSQQNNTEPASKAGFSFFNAFGDMVGTKYYTYKPAKLYDQEGKGLSDNPKWFVYYSYRNPTTKKFKRFKVYEGINSIKDEADRREFADQLIKAVNYGLKMGYNPFEKPLEISHKQFSLIQGLNYFKTHLHERGLRKRTIQSYESVIRQMYAGLKEILLDDITIIRKSQIESFLRNTAQKNNWSNATYNNNLTFIKSIFNYLIEQEITESSPAHKVKPLPASATKNRYFDNETFERIKQKAPEDLLKFLMFLYHTGTRPNEARQLKYDHIQRERKLLLVPASISKNKKDDYVPLSDYILNNYQGKGLIFGSTINFYTKKFSKLKKELNLPKEVTMYSIKHTRAIHLAEDGASPYSIMQLFRHSGLDITMSYLKDLGINIGREAAEKAR